LLTTLFLAINNAFIKQALVNNSLWTTNLWVAILNFLMLIPTIRLFKKDLKKLLKKYRTLNDDLFEVKAILKKKPEARPPFSFQIDNLGLETCVIKVKRIACRLLKESVVNS